MEWLKFFGFIAFIGSSYLLGQALKKQSIISTALEEIKQNSLKPGFDMNQKWYAAKRKNKNLKIFYISMCILLMACGGFLAWYSYSNIIIVILYSIIASFACFFWLSWYYILPNNFRRLKQNENNI